MLSIVVEMGTSFGFKESRGSTPQFILVPLCRLC
jgi:hypothetical protein